jgi:hypothetical protein
MVTCCCRVPVRPADRYHIVALLQRYQVHDERYFGPAPLSSSPSPIRADPDLPPEQLAALAAGASRTSRRARRMPERRVTPGDSRSFTAQPHCY